MALSDAISSLALRIAQEIKIIRGLVSGKADATHGHALTDANITGPLPLAQMPSHSHTAAEIASGVFSPDRLPVATTDAFGTVRRATSAEVLAGTDTSAYVTSETFTATGNALWSKPEQTVSVLEYGVVGDGVTEDTVAIQAALNDAALKGVALTFPTRTYLTKHLVVPSGSRLILEPRATLDFTTVAGGLIQNLITVSGSTGFTSNVLSVLTVGAYQLGVSDVSGFTVGDDVRLFSNDRFDASSTNVPVGEILTIKKIEENAIFFNTPILGTYTNANAPKLQKIDMARDVMIEGGVIKGGPIGIAQVGIRVSFAKRFLMRGTKFSEVTNCQVQLSNVVDSHITNCSFKNAIADTTGYGVSFANATQDSSCSFSTFLNVRHSLSTNNTSAPEECGIPRRVTFAYNNVRDSSTALQGSQLGGDAIDTHTAAEDIFILGNTVIGSSGQGINFECRSGRIEGNTVRYAASNGINVHNESDFPGFIVVRDNIISNTADKGLNVRSGGRGTTKAYDYLEVSQNTVTDTGFEGIFVGGSAAVGSPTVRHAIITNNIVLRAGSPTTTVGVYLYNMTDVIFTGNIITDDLSIPNYKGVRLTMGSRALIANNTITAGAANAWGVLVDDNFSNVTFAPNQYVVANTGRETYTGAGTGHKYAAYVTSGAVDPGYYAGTVSRTDASGFITIPKSVRYVSVDNFNNTATGDLLGINGGAPGQVITLTISSDARAVRAVHTNSGANRLRLTPGLGSFNMTSRIQNLTLVFSPHLNAWLEVARQGTQFTDMIDAARLPTASATVSGISRLSTPAEAAAGILGTVAVTPAGLKSVADTKTSVTGVISVVNHGNVANAARPVGAPIVYWVGSVEPTNAIDNDNWIGSI